MLEFKLAFVSGGVAELVVKVDRFNLIVAGLGDFVEGEVGADEGLQGEEAFCGVIDRGEATEGGSVGSEGFSPVGMGGLLAFGVIAVDIA